MFSDPWVNVGRTRVGSRVDPAPPPRDSALNLWRRPPDTAMAATSTASKQVITLKGSTDIVTEFFGFSINSILYQRGE